MPATQHKPEKLAKHRCCSEPKQKKGHFLYQSRMASEASLIDAVVAAERAEVQPPTVSSSSTADGYSLAVKLSSNAPSTATTTDGSRGNAPHLVASQAVDHHSHVKRPLVRTVSEVECCSICSSRTEADNNDDDSAEDVRPNLHYQLKRRGIRPRPPPPPSAVNNATTKRKSMQRCEVRAAPPPPPPPIRRIEPPSVDYNSEDDYWDNDDGVENYDEDVFLPTLMTFDANAKSAVNDKKNLAGNDDGDEKATFTTYSKNDKTSKKGGDQTDKSSASQSHTMKCVPNLYTQPPELMMAIQQQHMNTANQAVMQWSTQQQQLMTSAIIDAAPPPPLPQRRSNTKLSTYNQTTSADYLPRRTRAGPLMSAAADHNGKSCARRQHSLARVPTTRMEPPYYQCSTSRRRLQSSVSSSRIERNAAARFQQVYQQRRPPASQFVLRQQQQDDEQQNFRSFSVAAQPIYVVHGANGQPILLQQHQLPLLPPAGQMFQHPLSSADLLVPIPPTTQAREGLPAPPPPPRERAILPRDDELYSSYDKALQHRNTRQAAARRRSAESSTSEETENRRPIDTVEVGKQRAFWYQLSKVGSMTYAMMVTVLGCILYINDVLGTVDHNYVEVFQVYLFMMAITFFMFLHIDIRRFLKHERNIERHREQTMDVALRQVALQIPSPPHASGVGVQPHYNIPRAVAKSTLSVVSESTTVMQQQQLQLPQPYLFRTGRHAGSMYLKLGAIVFCFGAMIHDGLVFSKRLDLIMSPGEIACLNVIDLFTPVLNLIFSFYQLYFVFKLSNVVVNRYHVWTSFGFMHAIATNICVWFRTLVDETMQEFSRKITKTAAKLSAEAQKYVQERFIADNFDPTSLYNDYGHHHFLAAHPPPTPPTTHMTTNSNYHNTFVGGTNSSSSKLDQRLGIFSAASIISEPLLFHENNPLIPTVLKSVVDGVTNKTDREHSAIKQHTEFLYYYSHLANTSGVTFNDEYECVDDTFLSKIAREAAPYLYPFSIEYSLIAAAVCYTIWTHIGRVHAASQCTPASPADVARTAARLFSNHQHEIVAAQQKQTAAVTVTVSGQQLSGTTNGAEGVPPSSETSGKQQQQQQQHRSTMALYSAAAALAVGHANANKNNDNYGTSHGGGGDKNGRTNHDNVDPLYMHLNEICMKASRYDVQVDCRSTNRGLFPGILVMVFTVISIIIFFVTIPTKEYADTAVMINNISELCLILVTSIAIAFAFRQTLKLDVDEHSHGHTLDDFLLYIPLPCFFIHNFFSIIAGLAESNWLSIMCDILCLVQVIMQTTFIFDGLRRCAKSAGLQSSKPGRELITFLIVCNLAMWTFATFEIKRTETNPSQLNFYGVFEWGLITHLSVPLTIFYRFHSSACLVDIWRAAYQPPERH